MLDLIQKAHVTLKTFKRDEDGAALVEYGVILLVAVTVGLGALAAVAGGVNELLDSVADLLTRDADFEDGR